MTDNELSIRSIPHIKYYFSISFLNIFKINLTLFNKYILFNENKGRLRPLFFKNYFNYNKVIVSSILRGAATL